MTIHQRRYKQLVLGQVLSRWARKTPNNEAMVFRHIRYTFLEFDDRVNRLANGLAELGVHKGDRVAILFTNCNELLESFYAVAKLGGICVPLNFRMTVPEYVFQLEQTRAKAIIFLSNFSNSVQNACHGLTHLKHRICVGENDTKGDLSFESIIESSPSEEPEVDIDDDDVLMIMYTSGTTGNPKGVVITHKNLIMAAINYLYHGVSEGSKLIALPLFHIAGFVAVLGATYFGNKVILLDSPDPELIMKMIQLEKIENVGLVPVLWNLIVNHPKFSSYDLSSVRYGGTGAAPTPLSLKLKIIDSFPNMVLYEAFGQTETCAIGGFADTGDLIKRPDSAGRIAFYIEARIVDEDDNEVPPGEIGEIVYRGPTLMREYFENPDATSNAFKNGWFHSGDLVKQDEDGYLYVVDRKKDIIISGGENISAWEVENTLSAHPDIMEAAVIGVPDEKWGESVKAYVVLRPGAKILEDDVISFCKGKIAGYKKPRYVEFITELPRNPAGKVKKFVLKER
ncbi:MAG: long-chain fatty acid--CoA ligase [Desulfobacterales bacterium]